MSQWEPVHGAGIATRPFVASGKFQISLLTGDHLQIFNKSDGWYHGRNLLTQIEGIFPEKCVAYVEMKNIDMRAFLAKSEDLLIIEARLTLQYALEQIRDNKDTSLVCAITDCIADVMARFNAFKQTSSGEVIVTVHKELAEKVDKLRVTLGLGPVCRTDRSSISTLTTWGREMFAQETNARALQKREPQYVMFNCAFEATGLKERVECRFAIYGLERPPWITQPISKILSPESPRCELLFTNLDKKIVKDKLYMVIYTYETGDERNLISVCTMCLPPCKTDSAFRKPTVRIEGRSFECESNHFFYGMHERIINHDPRVMRCVKETIPSYTMTFTPFFGTLQAFASEKMISVDTLVQPFSLPSVIPASFRRSTVTLTIDGIEQHSGKKRSKLIFRLLDRLHETFLNCCEDPVTGEYDADSWVSASFKGIKNEYMLLNESFAFDLLKTKTPVKHLFIVVEVQRQAFADLSQSSSSYATIPLASVIGCPAMPADHRVPLYHFNIKPGENPAISDFRFPDDGQDPGRVVGSLSFSLNFASTALTTDVVLYKLLNFQQFSSELGELLQTFSECGLSEWCKFFKKLALNFAVIIASKPEVKVQAFNALVFIMSEILTRTSPDYVKQIDEFICEQFNKDKSTGNHPVLKNLYGVMLPLMLAKIQVDDTSIEFRNMVKCAPYLFEMFSRSIQIHMNSESIDASADNMEFLKIFIERYCAIVKEVSCDTDIHRKGFVYTNQQLVIQHFAAVIRAVVRAIPAYQVAPLVIQFLRSIRYVPEDRKQAPIDKSKMKCILALSSTECWTNGRSREILAPVFTEELTKASESGHCIGFIVQILASLFMACRNDYIVQFIPLLHKHYMENETPGMARLLLIIAYMFPATVPRELILRLVRSELLGASERMFVFSNIVLKEQASLEAEMKSASRSGAVKLKMIETYLQLSIMSATDIGDNVLDRRLNRMIYPTTNAYGTVSALFQAIPKEQRIGIEIVKPILHCYVLHRSHDLFEMFQRLIRTDAEMHSGRPKKLVKPLLMTLYELSKEENFENLTGMFSSDRLREFNETFAGVVTWLNDMRCLEYCIRNQGQLADAINSTIQVCESVHDKEILPKLLLKLADLHTKCQSYLEAGMTLLRILDFVPCDFNKCPDYITIEGIETGLELHKHILKEVINMFVKDHYEDKALEVIQRAKLTCVDPYKYYNLMPDLLNSEAKIYSAISSAPRTFSNYFLVGFYGKSFDRYYRNRSFVYRKNVSLSVFRSEFTNRFITATISEDPPTDAILESDEMYIQLIPIDIAHEEEVQNKMFIPDDFNLLEYNIEYQRHSSPCIFRYEKPLANPRKFPSDPTVHYLFFTQGSFPSTNYRLEIDPRKTIAHKLSPVESEIVRLNRATYKLRVSITLLEYLSSNNEPIDPFRLNNFTMQISQAVKSGTEGRGSQCVATFLAPEFPKEFPRYGKHVGDLRDALKAHIAALGDALALHDRLISLRTREMHNSMVHGFEHFSSLVL